MNYWERMFKAMDKKKRTQPKTTEKTKVDKGKEYCSGFVKGKDGYCIHYNGEKPFTMSCANQCNIEGTTSIKVKN